MEKWEREALEDLQKVSRTYGMTVEELEDDLNEAMNEYGIQAAGAKNRLEDVSCALYTGYIFGVKRGLAIKRNQN